MEALTVPESGSEGILSHAQQPEKTQGGSMYLEQGQVEKQTCAFGKGFRATS